jgi:hypothetical protein
VWLTKSSVAPPNQRREANYSNDTIPSQKTVPGVNCNDLLDGHRLTTYNSSAQHSSYVLDLHARLGGNLFQGQALFLHPRQEGSYAFPNFNYVPVRILNTYGFLPPGFFM